MSPDRLFALAEYSFLYADRASRQEYFLAASVYAFAFLFPEDGSERPDCFDPRHRTATEVYNRSLARALVASDGRIVAGTLPGHVGSLRLTLEPRQLDWADRRLANFIAADALEVRGIRDRHRRGGLGAPFIAETVRVPGRTLDARSARVIDSAWVPVTFVVRYADARAGLRRGEVGGSIEVYSDRVAPEIEMAGQRVPLEFETGAALAGGLEASGLWNVSRPGFVRGDFVRGLPSVGDGLFMLHPHVPGRTPVVLVHGTASTPARWAEMLNALEAEPILAEHYEFWLFIYATGNPILYSASLLRRALFEAVAEFDPNGTDEALRRMVLVGHSQGGLLAQLQAVSSGDRFWRLISNRPFDEVKLPREVRALLEEALFFEPVPFVRDVIFLATPHGGSFRARGLLGRLASRAFNAPDHLLDLPRQMARASFEAGRQAVSGFESMFTGESSGMGLERIPSSVENMTSDSPFLLALSNAPMDPAIRAHSIIAVRGDPPPDGKNDGVVAFEAARIEGAESEFVVFRSGHSVQSHPLGIGRVREILLQSLNRGSTLPATGSD